MRINRGDVFLANLNPIQGSEQGGVRPVLVVQNDVANKFSPVVIVLAITSRVFEKEYLTNVFVSKVDSGLPKNSTVLANQMRTVDKGRLIKKVGFLGDDYMSKINDAIKVCLGMD